MNEEKTAEVQRAAEEGAKEINVKVKVLSREDIINSKDTKKEFVKVEEWGGGVWVHGLSSKERDAFEETVIEGKGKNRKTNLKNFRARLCARCIRDENGKRLFKGDHIEALGEKSASAVDKVFIVAQRLSGMSVEDVEELVKN